MTGCGALLIKIFFFFLQIQYIIHLLKQIVNIVFLAQVYLE